MLSTPELIAPIIGFCEVSCGVSAYLVSKGNQISKLGWILVIANVVAFLYLNHILFVDMIQRVADTSDGYVSIFDDEFTSDVSRNIIQVMISYIVVAAIGSHLGAKKKFSITN